MKFKIASIFLLCLLFVASAWAAPCSDLSVLANGVDMIASSTYGFDLPKEHSTWSFGTATSTSATGTVLLNMQTGPGLLLMQKYLVQESVDTTGMGTVAAAQSRADKGVRGPRCRLAKSGRVRYKPPFGGAPEWLRSFIRAHLRSLEP